MKYDFDQVIDRHGTDSSKWDCGAKLLKRGYTTRYDKETIPLFNADMDFKCAPEIIKAMERVVARGIYGYTSIVDDDYYKAIQSWFFQYNSWKMEKEQIILERGTITGIVEVKPATVEITASILLSLFFTQTIPKNTDNMESITTVVSATINVVGIREHIFSHTLTPYLYEVPKSNLVNTPIIYSKNLFRNG